MAKSAGQARRAYILLEDRKNDLKKLQQEYSECCVNNEEKMCFLYCNFSIQQRIHNYIDTTMKNENIKFEDIEINKEVKEAFFKEAFEETVEFNSDFENPYKPRQLRSKMNVLTKKNYKFTTEKIILWLNLHEDVQVNLKTIASKEVVESRKKKRLKVISQERKAARRNENGLTSREQQKQNRLEEIRKLLKEGLNQSEIGRKLGITRQAVSKLKKEL